MADTSESGVPGETGGAGAEADAAAARPAGLASLRTSGGNLPGMRAAGGEESGSVPTGAAVGGPVGGPKSSGSVPVVGPKSTGSGAALRMPGPGGKPLPPKPGETVDEEADRFLIQKEDKMDYGPFSIREIRAQIEKGTVSAEHNILDNETGDRRRVADHPLIGKMAREWTAKHAELDRQMKDQSERAKHRDSVLKLLSGIFATLVVLGVIGGGLYWKFGTKPPPVVVKGPQFTEDPLLGLSIALKVDPPPPKKAHTGKKKGPKNGAFDDSQTMDMSDNQDTLSAEDIDRVMKQKFTLLAGCLREEAARNPKVKDINLEFIVKGNGSVSSVRVNTETSSPVASCVFAKMQAIQFPECKTCTKTHAAFSLKLK